ncbi:hypothetical protein MAPG_03282 [Magnaporthiopsis poae ATCC 64411]|uniref:Uncharacterized protein n=1 Tax=Magnaporthiopsis poae (strain ATCC 64411 / 73-15) TaxID=644358 RepID=A0A0C4DTL2_MAGP6|nr:hypothetical protein MAPG_03282 [Magnaporthiopsis poae ATCC 64411]
MLVPLLHLPAPKTIQLALRANLPPAMAPATNILLDFYGQTIENCRFMSHEDAEVAIITSMDPASGKFRATVVRSEGYGRKKKRAVIVSEVGTSLVEAIELLHTKSAEAVQHHVATFGYDVVPRKKTDPKRKSSAGNRWEDSEPEASDSDASDATESTAHLSETSLSDEETVSLAPTKNSKKKQKKPSATKPQAVRPVSPPFVPTWPSQNRMGVPPPPPGFSGIGIQGRQPANPPPGVFPNLMPRTNGPAIPRPMPPPPPKSMIPPMSAATVPSPPAPPVVSPTTASATGPSGVPVNLARPPLPMLPPGPRVMPMASGQPLNPADTNVENKRDAIVDIKWAGHDGSATIFVCCPLSKLVIGQQVLRYVRTHTSEFGPARTQPQNSGLIYIFTSVVLPVQSPKPGGGPEKTYGLESYENDDMSILCNRVSPSSAVPRFEVMVVGRSVPPPPPGPGFWGDAGKPRQTNLESTSDASVIVDDY